MTAADQESNTDVRQALNFSLAFLLYLLLALAVDSPFLFFGQSLYQADITYNIEPAARYMREVWLQTGRVPLWNPSVLCGAPQWQLIWPLFYLPGCVFLAAPFPLATGLFLLIHQLAAGFAGFVWQYRNQEIGWEQLAWFPPLLFGAVFMLSGYMAGSTINLSLFACAAWIPAVLLVIDRLTLRPRPWCIAVLGFLIGLQITAGRPEIFGCSLLLYLLYCWLRISQQKPGLAKSILILSSILGATLLGILLSAVDLLPMAQLAGQAPPAGQLFTLAMNYWSAGWFDFLALVLSQPFGPINMVSYHFYPTYPGSSQYLTSMYLGPPVLTAAVCGFADRRWSQRWFWLAILVLFALLSAGEFGPFLGLVHQLIPEQMLFRFPIKLSVFVVLPIAVAAAAGARALLDGSINRQALFVVGTLWFLFVIVAMLPLLHNDNTFLGLLEASPFELAAIGPWHLTRAGRLTAELSIAGLAGILACLTFFPFFRRRFRRQVAVAVLAVLSVGLLIGNAVNHLWNTVDGSFFEVKSALAERLQKDAGAIHGGFRVMSLIGESDLVPPVVHELSDSKVDPAYMQYARIVLMPNCGIDSGIALSNGVSTVPSWQSYFLSTGILPRASVGSGPAHPSGKSDLPIYRYCQATSTLYLLTASSRSVSPEQSGKKTAEPLAYLDGSLFKLLEENPGLNLRVYRVSQPRPRISFAGKIKVVASMQEALLEINRCDKTGYSPLNETLIVSTAQVTSAGESGTDLQRFATTVEAVANTARIGIVSPGSAGLPVQPGIRPVETGSGKLELTSDKADSISLLAETGQRAFVVLTDSYNPGWKAYDNGKPTEVYQADGLLMAVRIEPGRHEISLRFEPDSVVWGSMLSQAGLLLTGVLFLTGVLRNLR